jgi:hypothetical protein
LSAEMISASVCCFFGMLMLLDDGFEGLNCQSNL